MEVEAAFLTLQDNHLRVQHVGQEVVTLSGTPDFTTLDLRYHDH